MKKEFYTVPEVLKMGILPYSSIKSIRRHIATGKIKVVRGMTDERSRVFIPSDEIERLKRSFNPRPNKSVAGEIETK